MWSLVLRTGVGFWFCSRCNGLSPGIVRFRLAMPYEHQCCVLCVHSYTRLFPAHRRHYSGYVVSENLLGRMFTVTDVLKRVTAYFFTAVVICAK